MTPLLWFVTPAHGRLDLSAVCFAQRRRLIDELAEHGIEANCIVIADDENLEIAASLDFATIEQANQPLGRKVNDGIEWACREAGADYVAQVGSDDWVSPLLCRHLPVRNTVTGSKTIGLVSPDGCELTILEADAANPHGFMPWIIPAPLLRGMEYRPAREIDYGEDVSILNAIQRHNRWVKWSLVAESPLQCIDFKRHAEQLTSYEDTVTGNPIAERESHPFERLAQHYPAELVERMRNAYAAHTPWKE